MEHGTMNLRTIFAQYSRRANVARSTVEKLTDSELMGALKEFNDKSGPHKMPENIRGLYVKHYDVWIDYAKGSTIPIFTPGERKKIFTFLAEEIAVLTLEQNEKRKSR